MGRLAAALGLSFHLEWVGGERNRAILPLTCRAPERRSERDCDHVPLPRRPAFGATAFPSVPPRCRSSDSDATQRPAATYVPRPRAAPHAGAPELHSAHATR